MHLRCSAHTSAALLLGDQVRDRCCCGACLYAQSRRSLSTGQRRSTTQTERSGKQTTVLYLTETAIGCRARTGPWRNYTTDATVSRAESGPNTRGRPRRAVMIGREGKFTTDAPVAGTRCPVLLTNRAAQILRTQKTPDAKTLGSPWIQNDSISNLVQMKFN